MFFRKRANATIVAPAVSVPPSYQWDGNDGSWSSFNINVGDDGTGSKGQNFRVLISTSSALTIVPGTTDWCTVPSRSDCANARGIDDHGGQQSLGYSTSTSDSFWNQVGLYDIPLPSPSVKLWPDSNPNATWGTDNIGLGTASSSSTVLATQWVLQGITEDFFMGSFGLASLPVTVGTVTKDPFIRAFAGANSTSISYGYAAGAYYQNNSKGVVGSLVLGGYDQSRFVSSPNATISFPSVGNNTLAVTVQSITYSDSDTSVTSFTADTGGPFAAAIDSTLPYLWLPDSVCDQFVSKFQLTYDSTRNLYKVNDTAHTNNVGNNATLVFTVGSGTQTNDAISITLPYAAFDLEAGFPIFSNSTRYFPIKKSPTNIFVLGRAFLQEAYLVVDYERNQFTVAQANWSDPMPTSDLVTIYPTDYVAPPSSQSSAPASTHHGKSGIGGGAIAGIVIGVLAVFALLGVGFFFWRRRRNQQRKLNEKTAPQEIDTMDAGNEVKYRRVSELDSEAGSSRKQSMGTYYGNDRKEGSPFPPINEMESPPAELYSPPPGGETPTERSSVDYFTGKRRRRTGTRESSGNNTPGTPGMTTVHELPGDDGQFQVQGLHFERVESPSNGSPVHSRGPSDTSLNTNIDEVLANSREPSRAPAPDRRPSMHQRGGSDAPSESTAVSNPSPEELESWAMGGTTEGPERPLSPE